MSAAVEFHVNKSEFCLHFNAGSTSSGATSSGVFAGDDPLKFYFPLLLFHICTVFVVSHATHAALHRLRIHTPLVISQIIAGSLLGPSFLGRFVPRAGGFFATPEGWVQINTIGGYAFTLHLFIVGVKTDLGMMVRSGKTAIVIACSSIALPHVAMYVAGVVLRTRLPKPWTETFLVTNLTCCWSLSAFIVICCTLHDLHLLSSKLGRLAMSAALISDFTNTFIIAGVTAYLLASSPSEKTQMIGFYSCVSFSIFIASMALVARPVVQRLIRDVPEGALLSEGRLVAVLLICITCSFTGELLGLHATYGPFMLGLMLPGGAPLGVTLDARLERLVIGLLSPLLVAQGGMRMDVFELTDASTCALLEALLVVGVAAKFVACVLPCLYFRMPVRDAVIVGLMMNFKGITEVAYASAFMDSNVLDDQAYSVFMLTLLVVGSVSAAAVKHMYHPEEKYVANRRRSVEHMAPGQVLSVVVCTHSQVDVGPMLALFDASCPTPECPLAFYLLHLVPLAGLTTSVRRHFKLGDRSCVPSRTAATESERVVNAFQHFVLQRPAGSATLLPYVCIAPYVTMHDDVCAVALEKRSVLIVLPFHMRLAIDGSVEPTSSNASSIQAANINILCYSPCSVAILVDRGSLAVGGGGGAAEEFVHCIALYFLGGPDDREALALASHMAENASVGLTVYRFLLPPEWQLRGGGDPDEDPLDEEAVQDFVRRRVDDHRVVYREHTVGGSDEMGDVIRRMSPRFNLLVVGRRADSLETPLTAGISDWSEHLELGVMGDMLTSTDFGCRVSTLVVQQQTRAAAGEVARPPERPAHHALRKSQLRMYSTQLL